MEGDMLESEARQIMVLTKEGELTEWVTDKDPRVISLAFPAVVVEGPNIPGLRVVFDYKFPRDIPGVRIRASLFQFTGKKKNSLC